MNGSLSAERRRKTILSVVLAFICILYILPVLAVVLGKAVGAFLALPSPPESETTH